MAINKTEIKFSSNKTVLKISNKFSKQFFLLVSIISALLILAGLVFMYYFTNPFPKGPGGFNVSGHPVFYMLSQAFIAFILFTIAFVSSIMYLFKRKEVYDLVTVASAKVGILASALTLLIGIVWSRVEWGYFWQWEPRQTMTLLMFLFYCGLIIFRSTVDDYDDKAKLTAVFGIAAFPTVPMTNFIVGSLHPAPQQTSISSLPFMGIILLFIGSLLMFVLLLYFTVKLERLNIELEAKKFKILSNKD